jgi:hypothetical protein
MPSPGELSRNPRPNRIVINLADQPQTSVPGHAAGGPRPAQPRRKGSRVLKVLGFLGFLLAVAVAAVVAGGYFWIQSYKSKPAYSLALVVDAVQRNDIPAFDSLVDTDKIVESLVPQVTDKMGGQYASAVPAVLRQQLESMAPRVLPGIKQQVHDDLVAQVRALSAGTEGKAFPLLAVSMPYLVGIAQTGDTAKATPKLSLRPMELTMERSGDRWKIVGVRDDLLLQSIMESITREIPAVGPQIKKTVKRANRGPSFEVPNAQLPETRVDPRR